jgi:KDO2-lipid IV(A) lauroyltransferase
MPVKKKLKFFRYLLEYALVWLFYYGCRLFTLQVTSKWAGAFAKSIGPRLKISHVARRNLSLALPDLSPQRHEEIIKGMWENLGRTFGEYPHLSHLDIFSAASPLTIEGQHILEAIRAENRPIIFFLGHLANWEYATMPARVWGFEIAQLFRPLNNPPLARFIIKVHKKIAPELVTKGQQGARQMIEVLKRGKNLSMLVDQKLNEGLPIPFFNEPAMTAPALARLAIKFNAALVPVQVIRTKEHACHVIYHPPLPMHKELPQGQKIEAILQDVNQHLENWIRENPQDWLWLHKRWPQSH